MRLFLLRHGAVDPTRHGTFYGGTEVALSPQGCIEAKKAAFQLKGISLTAIYASPLSRAQFGAKCVLQGRPDLELHLADEFLEIERGRWVGFTPEQVDAKYPEDRNSHRLDPWNWRAHGGESLGDLRTRVLRGRDNLRRRYPDHESIVLVSHMFPTRAILADALGLDLPAWSEMKIDTGSVSLVEYAPDGSATVIFMGRT